MNHKKELLWGLCVGFIYMVFRSLFPLRLRGRMVREPRPWPWQLAWYRGLGFRGLGMLKMEVGV